MSPSYAKPTTPAETAANSPQIPDEAYRALEDIVGADNVSRDAAVLDGYAFQWLAELVRPDQSHYMPRPAAVVLPGSTEEVQAIVRLANKYGLKVKPHGTGWYHWSGPIKDEDATLQLDMRRMDAIVEIDEQNMYAVVEPYVIAAQLQAEILPLGLNLNIPGVGCSSSIVASACAYHGAGPDTYFMGGNAENVLGMEWVTPEGEIVRTGSLGSGDGWFCSEGPGPSRARHLPGHARQSRRPGRVHQVRRQARPAPGPDGVEGRGHAARLPPAGPRAHARLHARRARLGRLGRHLLPHLRQRDRLHLPPPVQPGRRRPLARLLAHVQRRHEDALRRARHGGGPRGREAHRGAAHQLPADPAGAVQGGHRAAGQDPRRHPRGGRRLEGRALLRAGHGRVHQRLPAEARPQAHQLRLGRRLHRQLDAVRHAGLGQGLHPDGRRRPRARRRRRQARAVRRRRDDGLRLRHPARRRHGPRAVRQLRPGRLRVHRGRHQAHGGRGEGRGVHQVSAGQGVPVPADRLDRRGDLERAGARQAAAGVPLPAHDQGGVRPEQHGRPHVPDAAAGLRAPAAERSRRPPDGSQGGPGTVSRGRPTCSVSQA